MEVGQGEKDMVHPSVGGLGNVGGNCERLKVGLDAVQI